MPVIRVSQETYERLKRWAVDPFRGKPDDAIRQLLDFADKHQAGAVSAAPKGPATSVRRSNVVQAQSHTRAGWQSRIDLYAAIIEAIRELGGSAHVEDVLPRVKRRIPDLLTPYYVSIDPTSGTERWMKATHSARMKLVEKGVLKSGSPRGLWELNPNAPSWP